LPELKQIKKTKWILPTQDDGNAWVIRATKAEELLKQALYLLEKVHASIPQCPAREIKKEIEDFLIRFR
jgi:hypothetical protein